MIDEIRHKVADDLFELSTHTLTRSTQRGIFLDELIEAMGSGDVIENYPYDRHGQSCLLLGYTKSGRALHVQLSHPSRPLLKIITIYEPTPDKWETNLKTRKR